LGVLRTALTFRLSKTGLWSSRLFSPEAAELPDSVEPMPSMTVAEPLPRKRAA
jgi:hypothetical protein